MPTVPSRRLPGVTARPLTPAFRTATGATSAAFGGREAEALASQSVALRAAASGALGRGADVAAAGRSEAAGLEGLGRGVTQVGQELGNILLQRQLEDNEREAKQLDIKYSAALRLAGHGDGTNENPGFYNTRGQNTLDTRKAAEDSMHATRAALLDSAANPRVNDMFSQASLIRLESEMVTIARHSGSQRKVANDNVSDARIAESGNNAVLNPWGDTDAALNTIAVEMEAKADNNGWSEEIQGQETLAATSKTISDVIDKFIADDALPQAEEYLEKYGTKELLGGTANTAIQERLTRARNQKLVILAQQASDVTKILDAGKSPAPEQLQQVVAGLNQISTPRSKAIKEELDNSLKDFSVVRDHNQLPIAQQNAEIARLNNKDTLTTDEFRVLSKLARATGATQKAIADGNGIAMAAANKVITPLAPMDLDNAANLQFRANQAASASASYGVSISPFTDSETDTIVETLLGTKKDGSEVTFQTSLETMQTLVGVLGADRTEQLADAAVNKAPEISVALQMATADPEVSRRILSGGRFARANKDVALSKDTRTSVIDSIISNAFPDQAPQARAAYAAAADAYYASLKSEVGDLEEDEGMYEQALEAVTGGVLSRNGQSFIAPVPGVTESQVNDAMERVTIEQLALYGNGIPVFSDGSIFDPDDMEEGQLRTVGIGVVAVGFTGSGLTLTDTGELYEFDLRRYLLDNRQSLASRRIRRAGSTGTGVLKQLFEATRPQ